MSNDTRQASGGTSKAKRRVIEADEEPRQNPTDDYASNPKRQRVSRACDSCRSKKDKCDGVQPVCSTCASLCRPCTYKANPKKRGLPTGYIRTLELLWGLVFCKIQGSEEVVRALLRAANIPSHLATMGKEAEGSDTLLSSWKNSIVLKEIERLLVSLEQPEDEQPDRGSNGSPADADGSSGLSADVLEWQIPEGLGVERENGLSPVKTPSVAPAVRAHAARFTRDSITQTSSPSVEEIPNMSLGRPLPHLTDYRTGRESLTNHVPQLPSNAWPLLDIYFSYTQCWFPILEKHDILRTAFRHSENAASPSAAGSGDHAALWAVLTLASIQESSITTTRQLPQASERPDPGLFYATAKRFIPGENGVHEIGHAQALLILSLVKLGQQDWTAAWILVGQAVRIAQCLGLDCSSTPGKDAGDGGGRGLAARSKHVFLGCFVLETLVAAQTGQMPSLRKSDLAKVGPINEDGLEEWHPWEDQTGLRPVETSRGSFHRGPLHALSTFNRLASLMCILNDTCCLQQPATDTDPVSQVESSERQLQLWVSALPQSYRVSLQGNPERPASPHIFGLEMMYENVVSHLSLRLALHGGDGYRKRATDSSQRLLMLLQTYMESYSLSATCPTFGMLLTSGLLQTRDKGFDLEPGLKHKLHSFASHLATVWAMDGRIEMRSQLPGKPIMVAASHPQGHLPIIDPTAQVTPPQPPLAAATGTARRASLIDEARAPLPGSEPFLSNQWMRTPSNVEDSAAMSLPTPTPSLNINRSAETSHPAPSFKDADAHQHRASVSSSTRPSLNGTSMMSELTSPFPPAAPQYPPTYNEPNLNMGSFVDVDGYGPLRRPRIAPDLDALFDELASLDGTEK